VNSLILSIAARFLLPILLVLSFFLLLRGHNLPGGGFAGGLVAGIALALYLLTLNVEAARQLLPCRPQTMIALGLLLAGASGVLALLAGRPFLQALWHPRTLPILGGMHFGTPLIFDVGVYLVAAGIILLLTIVLEEEQ
jgi:multicomponent Na+:H+ antiporter subunit B